MSILSAMQAASLRVYGRKPQVFFGSSSQTEMEICDWANEVAADVAASHDWQGLVKLHDLTGDGVTAAFPLPADYDRMLINSQINTTPGIAFSYQPVADVSNFLAISQDGVIMFPGIWSMFSDAMNFYPVPGAGDKSYFPYISKNYAKDALGTPKPQFDNDTDISAIPDRLLTLGIVWRWRDNKGLDTTGDQEAFVKAFNEYASRDKGSRTIRKTHRWNPYNVKVAYPWELG